MNKGNIKSTLTPDISDHALAIVYGHVMKQAEWSDKMPYLQFPSDWYVKITPPYLGALIRFKIRKKSTPKDQAVSIYFDAYNFLGGNDSPYWEIYPYSEEASTARFAPGEEDLLIEAIAFALQYLEICDDCQKEIDGDK